MAGNPASEIKSVTLELLRSGPAHNQLLSPLTRYIALCGADGPVAVQLPFEHRQLLMRLQRLRYPLGTDPATDEQRQAEVRDMGEIVGHVFGQVPALLSELGNACAENGKLIHLRLSLSAFELGMIPFEAAVSPDGFPGSGSPLFLQTRMPVSLTREIRRGRPLPIAWSRKPRILFAFAAPSGLYVPAQAHLQALRESIEPWVKIVDKDKPEARVRHVKDILTVLPDASLEKIRKLCATDEFTHVHILAHGMSFKHAGDERHGMALHSEIEPGGVDIVDGERLAIALTSRDASGTTKSRPTLVTLATCDSGNIESVLTPGGSIAHELNAAGIPWVIASQFPLWMRASAIAAEVLYRSLLNGDDPRWVLHKLRQRLRTDSPGTHDWASIVAYATVPWDFEQQVNEFRDQQTRKKLNVIFDRIDELVGANVESGEAFKAEIKELSEEQEKELESLCGSIRGILKTWREEPHLADFPKLRAERLGMSGASEKRIGIAYSLVLKTGETEKREAVKKAYGASRDFYRKSLEADPLNHWAITQYLSLIATPILAGESSHGIEALQKEYGQWWIAARQIAEWQLDNATEEEDRAWALGTLGELTLLGAVYGGQGFDPASAQEAIRGYCKEMRESLSPDAFPLFSTKRQFRRYLTCWSRPDHWDGLAEMALQTLGTG